MALVVRDPPSHALIELLVWVRSCLNFTSRLRRKRNRILLRTVLDGSLWTAVGLILTGALPGAVFANPKGATVAAGSVTIERTATRVDVHQATDRAIIDWRSFSIAPGETTQFHQPSAASMALNRVTGADPSHIFGSLIANGRVILVNPNGILFGILTALG